MSDSIRDVRLFVAAYEEGSFTAAARRELATQSGVSQHIRKLEDRFGVRLFERVGGRVSPTPAGVAYYDRCLEVLKAHAQAQAAVARFAGGLAGEISVGLMPTMTRSALAPALALFAEQHPNVSVRVVEAYSGVLTTQIRAGELDFAIVPAAAIARGVRMRRYLTTVEALVSGRAAGRRHMAPVQLKNLSRLKLIVPGPANTRRVTLESRLAQAGVEIAQVMELDAMMGTLDLVARSDWVTILPGVMMSADVEGKTFTVNPIVAPPIALELVAIEPARRSLSEPAQAFFAVIAAETAKLNAPWQEVLADGPKPARADHKS